ncbi:MAG: hypothetical protein F4234_08850 [Gammaproteobacteria bacterium]|nr:hypothetical protein [Gammaproteobacteria bacterium]
MADSHAEDATGISAAVKKLATKKELSKSEKRLGAAAQALRKEILDELGNRDEQIRNELKSHTSDAVFTGGIGFSLVFLFIFMFLKIAET